VLSGVVERAAEWGRIQSNPVKVAKLPPARREREVQPMPPRVVEAIRAQLGPRDATLVCRYSPTPGLAPARPWHCAGGTWKSGRC
jgi:hypothetical protein